MTEPLIALRLAGRDMIPGTVSSRELAAVIAAFEEMLACVVEYQHTNIEKEDVVVGLASMEDGSIRFGFTSVLTAVVLSAYLSVAHAVTTNDFTALPHSALRALDRIVAFTRRHQCVAELRAPETDALLAAITPATNTQIERIAEGQTTIYGRILRVGGKTPRVTVETVTGDEIFCDVSLAIAQALGRRLYEFAELSGVAVWNPDGWRMKEFRIESFTPSGTKTPEEGMNELRSLVGRYFDDIEDVEAYVSSLRRATEET
jgi:hypothetical protein